MEKNGDRIILCLNTHLKIKTSGSKSRPRKVELASAHKKRDDYRKYFTHNNEACKNPYKTTLPHLYVTGYWKTDHNVTLGQLHFIGPNSHTHALSMH